jgi:hypothetical protein
MENKICVRCGMEYPNHKMSCKIPVEEWRLPTAEEFALKDGFQKVIDHVTIKRMQEFAKLHVQKALKDASENAALDYWKGDCQLCGSNTIDKDSILNAYPLDKIN